MVDSKGGGPLEGTAYGRPKQTYNALLAEVGPGTPCGEYMRRFWQPVLASRNVTHRPQEVRILGEDLIIFRDRTGRPGLLYPRCMHRGTSLFWGKTEERGIRCCYHGWLFDVEGRCLEQPCEPNMGSAGRDKVRQPWYPVQERYGLVWTYMGPPDRMPILPRYDIMENLREDEEYCVHDNSWGSHNDTTMPVVPYSWLHMNDNIVDPSHVEILHTTFSIVQFQEQFAIPAETSFEYFGNGVKTVFERKLPDGRCSYGSSVAMLPNIMSVPNVVKFNPGKATSMGWVVPVDDTHCRIIHSIRASETDPDPMREPARFRGKRWSEMTIEDRQDTPGDFEAQAGQGPISLHSEEHLVTADIGVTMLRRMLEREIRKVQAGEDPTGVIFDPADEWVEIPSGAYVS